MSDRKRNLLLILSLTLIFTLCLIVAAVLAVQLTSGGDGLSGAVSLEIEIGEVKRHLSLYQSPSDSKYYAFLPSGVKALTLIPEDDCKQLSEGIQLSKKYALSELVLNSPYEISLICRNANVTGEIVFMASDKIPSLFIDTESGTLGYINASKNNSEGASCQLFYPDGELLSENITEISGRGNTSWELDKKGYNLTFARDITIRELDPSGRFVLIANANNNYLSNTIGFYLEKELEYKYSMSGIHIDLYFNGEYSGSYLLAEKIAAGSTDIPIDDLDAENSKENSLTDLKGLDSFTAPDGSFKGVLYKSEPDDVSGGYIIERDVPEYYAGDISGFITASGDRYVLKSPKYAAYSEVEYIKGYFEEAHAAIASHDGYNPDTGLHYTEYIDIESFAKKYVLEEFLGFSDAGRSSAYYIKPRADKLYAGPGWDYGGAFTINEEYITKLNYTPYSTSLYEELLSHEDFRLLAYSIYQNDLSPAIKELTSHRLGDMAEEIKASAAMDAVRFEKEDFLSDTERILTWMKNRRENLDKRMRADAEFVTVTLDGEWLNRDYVYLAPGDTVNSEQLPRPVRDGYRHLGWVLENGDAFDFTKPIHSDITLYASWEKLSSVSLIQKFGQIIPELCFAIAFVAFAIVFTVKYKNKEKKK